jgi:hypothetical protein
LEAVNVPCGLVVSTSTSTSFSQEVNPAIAVTESRATMSALNFIINQLYLVKKLIFNKGVRQLSRKYHKGEDALILAKIFRCGGRWA